MPCLFPLLILGLMVLYYYIDPFAQSFPVKCYWKVLTDTDCPSCGIQRAIYCLAHGNFLEALSYNYFFVLSIPYALSAVVATWYNFKGRFDGLKRFVFHHLTLRVYVVLFFLWWVIRNVLNI